MTAATPQTAQHTVPALRMLSTIGVEGTGGPSNWAGYGVMLERCRRMSAATSWMHARVSDHARASPKRSTRLIASMRSPALVVDLAGDRHHRHVEPGGEGRDAADDLALEALLVEEALAGDHEVGAFEPRVELHLVGHEVEPAHQPTAGRGQAAGETTGGPGPLEGEHVDAVIVEVHLGQPLEAPPQELDLRGGRTLLRCEDRPRRRGRARGCRTRRSARCPSGGRSGAGPAARPARRRWSPIHRGR